MAVNSVYKLLFLSFIFAVLLSITVPFIALMLERDIVCQLTKFLLIFVQIILRYYDFLSLRRQLAIILRFCNCKILLAEEVWRIDAHHRANICRLLTYCNVLIF